jgi:hypothetical protein
MSIFKGTYALRAGKYFRNVIGSTNDPFPQGYTGWLELWEAKCGGSAGYIVCSACGRVFREGFSSCLKSDFVGGHIVLGPSQDVVSGKTVSTAAKDLRYSNRVFIVPLCKHCNSQDNKDLYLVQDTMAVWLAGFYFDEDPEHYRQSFEDEKGYIGGSYPKKAWNAMKTDIAEKRDRYMNKPMAGYDDYYIRSSAPSVSSVSSGPSCPSIFKT